MAGKKKGGRYFNEQRTFISLHPELQGLKKKKGDEEKKEDKSSNEDK